MMFDFASLTVGQEIGRREITLEPSLVEGWRRLFPQDDTGEVMPPGMAAIVTMRAYSAILTPRPPGNVHGAQRFEILRLPSTGERLVTRVSCVSKEVKKDRLWVAFATETSGSDARPCFRGRQTILWAA